MARKVRDKKLDTREERGKLKPRGKPYYREIERGLHLGYRKLKGRAGTWWARHYVGHQAYEVASIGAADDLSDADGVAILDYWQAQTKAREAMVSRAHKTAGKTGPLTVAQVMKDYLDFLATERKSEPDARNRYEAFIKPAFGDVEVNALTAEQITAWRNALAKKAPRIRTKTGEPQKHRELGKDDESVRRRKATANRTLIVLKAALNRAWRTKRKFVPSDAEWRAVEPFKNADAARIRYLSVAEAKRLVNASDPDFRKLVQAALQTGCRYGELARLTVADFNDDVGTLAVRITKTGKPRHVVLTDEGIEFFRQLCAGLAGDKLILTHADGSEWKKSHQGRPMLDACARAKIAPAINFHGLRHTWASLAVMNGMPLMVVGKNLGHRDTRMVEMHYGHLAPSYIVDAIRAGAPKFGFKPDPKIATLAGRA
jgi:integrase